MKKRFIILLFMFGFIGTSYSQNGLWYGVSVGTQNTLISSRNSSEIDVKKAYRPITTLDIEYRFSPKMAIQSGLGYARYTQNTSRFKNDFDYLVVPAYIKLGKFKENKKNAFSALFGVNYKILLSAKNIFGVEKNDISKFTSNAHIDFTAGLGLKHKLRDNLVLESHITGAFGQNFNKDSFDGFLLTNFNYGLSFGLKYNLSKNKD